MKPRLPILILVLIPCTLSLLPYQDAEAAEEKLTFRVQEIERSLGVGYAVLIVDVNGDGKKDIVVVDKTRVVWYENPTWKRRTMIEGAVPPLAHRGIS